MRIPASLLARSTAASTTAIVGSLLFPAAGRIVRLPEVRRRQVDELQADLYLAPGGPWPGVVLVVGALREGRHYPILVTVANALAACGYAVLVPELGRLRRLVLGEDALEDLISATVALTEQRGVRQTRVGLVGFSLGGSLALLAAADERLRGGVACVASLGAYFSVDDMLTAATMGTPALAAESAYAVVASLVATLPDRDRKSLEKVLEDRPESAVQAISQIEPSSVGPEARAVLAVLMNRDPGLVPALLREVETPGSTMLRLSPERVIDRIEAPVWVLHDERDRFVPFHQSQRLRMAAAGKPNYTFISTRLLEHTEPNPPAGNPREFFGDFIPGLVGLLRFAYGPLAAVRNAPPWSRG